MNKLSNIVLSIVTLLTLDMYVQPAYSTTGRDIVIVSEKKYISPEHIVGLDTYDNPVNYYRQEEYILKFKDRNGYFNVNKKLFKESWVGRQFTIEDNSLYYCRPAIDGCNSSE